MNIVDNMTKRASGRVLPAVKSGNTKRKSLRSVDDLLSTKQQRALRQDLVEMAKVRREAEATSSTLRLS